MRQYNIKMLNFRFGMLEDKKKLELCGNTTIKIPKL